MGCKCCRKPREENQNQNLKEINLLQMLQKKKPVVHSLRELDKRAREEMRNMKKASKDGRC
jgi:hypothetical protein